VPGENVFFQLPQFSALTLGIMLAVLIGLFVLAVYMERLRKRRVAEERVRSRWHAAQEIIDDKELTDSEMTLLRTIVDRYAHVDPVRAVTVRREFDRCVEKEMDRSAAEDDRADYERRGAVLRDIRQRLFLDVLPIGRPIASTRELQSGQLIELGVSDESPGTTYVVRRVNEAFIYMQPENGGTRPSAFHPGQDVPCAMWREDDARYTFSLTVERFDDRTGMWVFRHTKKLDRYQQRDHFRVPYHETVEVEVVNVPVGGDPESHIASPVSRETRGLVTSLSAGGLAVVTSEPIPNDALLRFNLPLGEVGQVTVAGTVVGMRNEPGGRHFLRVQFVAVDEETEDRIARFVALKQQLLVTPEADAKA